MIDYPWAVEGAKAVYKGCTIGVQDGVSIKRLVPGEVYTIRSIDICPITGQGAVRVVGIHNALCPGIGREHGYYVGDFRPLHDLKADIAKFTHLLNTTDEVVDA